MGIFDKAKNKAQELAGQHGDKVDEGVTKAKDFADEKTGGKYSEQIDTAAEKAREYTQGQGEQPPPQQ